MLVVLSYTGSYDDREIGVVGTYSEGNLAFAQAVVDKFNSVETYSARLTRLVDEFKKNWIDPATPPSPVKKTRNEFDVGRYNRERDAVAQYRRSTEFEIAMRGTRESDSYYSLETAPHNEGVD